MQKARSPNLQRVDNYMPGRMVDVKSYYAARRVEVSIEPVDNLHGVNTRRRLEFNVEAVRIWVIAESHWLAFLKRESMKALCIVFPSDKVTTRRIRVLASPGAQSMLRTLE